MLNEAIHIHNCGNVLLEMGKTEKVLEFVYAKGYDTYIDFVQYYSDMYGIDVEEYRAKKDNGFNIDQNLSSADIYDTTNTNHIRISIISKNRKTIFDDSGIVDEEKLENEIKNNIIFPVYVQNYTLPVHQILKSNKVGFEFNILDGKSYIDDQFKKVYSLEKKHKRTIFSSTKQKFLSHYFSNNSRMTRFESINAIKKSFVIYQYRQHCDNLEEARLLYNFHILFTNFEKMGFKDDKIYLYPTNPSKDQYLYIEREHLITGSYLTKEITDQLDIITSLLHLKGKIS